MREKYETLAIKDLRAIAKIRGVKGASSMSKGQVIEVLLLLDETEEKAKLAAEADDAIRAEEAKRAVMSRSKKSSDAADAGDVKKPRGRKPAAKAEETSETNPATEAKPASDAKPATGTSDERAKALIDEAFERQARLNPDKTPEELKAAYFEKKAKEEEERNVDSGIPAHGILEIMPDGFGFIRCENFLPGENDVYVAPGIIRKYGLRTGDIIKGSTKVKTQNEKFSALLSLTLVNGFDPETISKRVSFENMTPIFPDNRIRLEMPGSTVAMRVMDLLSPVGKGQRGMIVSPPKAGKTTLLKEVAKSVKRNNPEIHLIILLIDERPEEVTDIKEAIEGPNVEVIYSTFDELPEHHKRVSEMVIERAKRLVEHHKDVMILLDSITRLTRAYNLTVPPSGRTLSGGLDPAALHMPKRFFGAARNMREGGSLTILATALVETGSKMDDVVYEEFKGTGNMEMVLDRKLSEKRIFPAIDIAKSGTRRDDLLLTKEEIDAVNMLRKGINGLKPEESVDRILDMFAKTRGNNDFIHMVNKIQLF
ncbi:MAG: transcription termination factor Rho [Lachnospiraceae bacterium]|nr:transcription termination factor Rho [Lachnospiraceae bacterium]